LITGGEARRYRVDRPKRNARYWSTPAGLPATAPKALRETSIREVFGASRLGLFFGGLPAGWGPVGSLPANDASGRVLPRGAHGTEAVVSALLDMLLYILRAWLDEQTDDGPTTGWAATLRDPAITADRPFARTRCRMPVVIATPRPGVSYLCVGRGLGVERRPSSCDSSEVAPCQFSPLSYFGA
jgi:hypothetical protein